MLDVVRAPRQRGPVLLDEGHEVMFPRTESTFVLGEYGGRGLVPERAVKPTQTQFLERGELQQFPGREPVPPVARHKRLDGIRGLHRDVDVSADGRLDLVDRLQHGDHLVGSALALQGEHRFLCLLSGRARRMGPHLAFRVRLHRLGQFGGPSLRVQLVTPLPIRVLQRFDLRSHRRCLLWRTKIIWLTCAQVTYEIFDRHRPDPAAAATAINLLSHVYFLARRKWSPDVPPGSARGTPPRCGEQRPTFVGLWRTITPPAVRLTQAGAAAIDCPVAPFRM